MLASAGKVPDQPATGEGRRGRDGPGEDGAVDRSLFSATKIAGFWTTCRARARAERGKLAFGTVDTWLVWNLTSGKRHITDRTNASRTMLYNIVEGRWDEELLRLFGIPESMMPEVVLVERERGAGDDNAGAGRG